MAELRVEVHWRALDGGRRLAVTHALRERGQPDIAVVVAWPPEPAADDAVATCLRDIVGYARRSGRALVDGHTITYSWASLRFVAPPNSDSRLPLDTLPPDALLVEETTDPYGDPAKGYTSDLRTLAHVLVSQEAVLRRHGLFDQAECPPPSAMAVICSNLVHQPTTHRGVQAMRWPPSKPGAAARWQIGCADDEDPSQNHDHDDLKNWSPGHLGHLVADYPYLLPYLALPAGCSLHVCEEHFLVYRPDDEQGYPEPGDPRTWRP